MKVKLFQVQRHYFKNFSSKAKIQLDTFVDASEDVYAAVCYFRIIEREQIMTQFVCAKTKCSPLKKAISIPRLELESAILGSRLCCTILENHNISVVQRFFWTDSAIVINWIKTPNRRAVTNHM